MNNGNFWAFYRIGCPNDKVRSTAATLSTAHPISALQSVIAFYINYTALLMQARLVTPSRAYYLTALPILYSYYY